MPPSLGFKSNHGLLRDACTVLLICNNDSTGKGNMTCHQSLGIGTKRGDLGRERADTCNPCNACHLQQERVNPFRNHETVLSFWLNVIIVFKRLIDGTPWIYNRKYARYYKSPDTSKSGWQTLELESMGASTTCRFALEPNTEWAMHNVDFRVSTSLAKKPLEPISRHRYRD